MRTMAERDRTPVILTTVNGVSVTIPKWMTGDDASARVQPLLAHATMRTATASTPSAPAPSAGCCMAIDDLLAEHEAEWKG